MVVKKLLLTELKPEIERQIMGFETRARDQVKYDVAVEHPRTN